MYSSTAHTIVIVIVVQGGTLHYLSPELLQPQPPPIPPAAMAGGDGADVVAGAKVIDAVGAGAGGVAAVAVADAPISPQSAAGSSGDLFDSRTADNWYGSDVI